VAAARKGEEYVSSSTKKVHEMYSLLACGVQAGMHQELHIGHATLLLCCRLQMGARRI
jgi:hypothetical protein